MEYRHTPPNLTELREFRNKVSRYLEKKAKSEKTKGLFSSKKESFPESEFDLTPEELIQYELDVILAHLENQNELLLELVRKSDRR